MAKSKQQGPRGRQGVPGPPGPAGKTGSAGAPGISGPQRRYRPARAKGRGRSIDNIYRELDVQMKRMAQLQVQLDDVRKRMYSLASDSN